MGLQRGKAFSRIQLPNLLQFDVGRGPDSYYSEGCHMLLCSIDVKIYLVAIRKFMVIGIKLNKLL